MSSVYKGPYMVRQADLNLLLQKELTSNVYNTKRSSIEWLISSVLRDEEVFART